MKNNLIKISFGILAVCLFTACASVRKAARENNPVKEKRPFQEREFNAAAWRKGDSQTRGEMTKDLRWKKSDPQNYILDDKNRRQVLEILGEPDRKTRGRCCGAGGTFDEEVW